MGHVPGLQYLTPQASSYDLMLAGSVAGGLPLPDSAVVAAVARGKIAQTKASGQGGAAVGPAQAKDAVFAALAQPEGGTTRGKAAARAWWLLYGQE
jgi:hypothetical protein